MKLRILFPFLWILFFVMNSVANSNVAKSSSIGTQSLIAWPKGCVGRVERCAVKAMVAQVIDLPGVKVHASAGSSFLSIDGSQWELMSGKIWIEKGQIKLQQRGLLLKIKDEVFVELKGDQLVVRNFNGDVRIHSALEEVDLPRGFRNWYVGDFKVGGAGISEPLDFKEDVRDWSKVVQMDHGSVLERAEGYRQFWQKANHEAGQVYQGIFQERTVAIERQESEKERRERLQKAELEKLRRIYHKKFYEGVDNKNEAK